RPTASRRDAPATRGERPGDPTGTNRCGASRNAASAAGRGAAGVPDVVAGGTGAAPWPRTSSGPGAPLGDGPTARASASPGQTRRSDGAGASGTPSSGPATGRERQASLTPV